MPFQNIDEFLQVHNLSMSSVDKHWLKNAIYIKGLNSCFIIDNNNGPIYTWGLFTGNYMQI